MFLLGSVSLLSTSRAVRKSIELWDVSGDGEAWTVELDDRDLGGHLDFTRAGILTRKVKDATHGVAAVGAVPVGFQVKLGWFVVSICRAGLHAVEASHVSASSVIGLRAAIVRSVWSSRMPLADTPDVLSLPDGPVGVDPGSA